MRLLLFFSLLRFVTCNWGLKEMGLSYFDNDKEEAMGDKMDVEYFEPIKKDSLCHSGNKQFFDACSGKKYKILLVDQLPTMATQLGCGKRIFHLLEALIGLGHSVSMSYLRPDKQETQTDKDLMEKLGVPILR